SLTALDPTEAAGVGVPRLGPDDHHPRPRTAGWMSWNCLGPEVCGADVLEAATTLVPEGGVALLDDGWMPRWGDWHERDDLDTSIADLAAAVRESGRTLGVWVAPFLVDPSSQLAAERRDLLLLGAGGGPVVDARPTPPQWVLDASRRTVREHLAALGARL